MGRARKDCPICGTENLLKLSNHMRQVHNLASTATKEPTMKTQVPQSATSWSPETKVEGNWWEKQSLLPFEPCSSIMVSGPTGAGKTQWVYRFLQHINGMYIQNSPKKILFCYAIHQPLFDQMEVSIPNVTLHHGLPNEEVITEFTDGLIVLDDLQDRVIDSKDMELLFTQGCHHRRISVVFLTQNLYGQGKSARTIALNSWYLASFRKVRGTSQVKHLNSQLFPHKGNLLLQAYEDAVRKPFGYLVIDLSPRVEDQYRLRTRIFPGEDPIVYS